MIIRNRDELISHGNVRGRDIVLKIIDGALGEINSYDLVRGHGMIGFETVTGG